MRTGERRPRHPRHGAQNPLIIPVKILRAHTVTSDGLGALDMVFHPSQPWIFTAGADRSIKLFQNCP